jgi:hypothetical protein
VVNSTGFSNTARKTLFTICLQMGMPNQTVMKISGDSDFNSMCHYIKKARKDLKYDADSCEVYHAGAFNPCNDPEICQDI